MAQVVHQFATGHSGGGGAPDDRVDVVSIGGTASAGDLLECVTTGVAGDWDEVPSLVDDVSGSTGWSVEFDHTELGGENLRVVAFRKIAVGGETTITATWTGPVNHGVVGAWISDPVLSDIVFLSGGLATAGGGFLRFTNTAPIPDNGATYIGGVGWGNSGVTRADFESPPSPTTEGGDGYTTAGAGTGGIQHYNDDGGTTADTLIYQFQPDSPPRVVMYWWATAEGAPPPVDGASEGGLLLGEATPDLGTRGASDGGVLLGTAEALVEGGDVQAASDGGVLAGRPSPTVRVRPGPPVPVPAIANVLGCGVYEVLAFTRGGGEVVGSLEFDNLSWARQLDATSSASMVIDGVTNLGALDRCCELLGSLNPWEHELAIYRQVPGSHQKRRVWMGPIARMRFPNESVVIEALDLSGWLQRRTLHANHNFVAVDLISMWVAWVEDAMGVDNSPGLYPTVLALSGILADRLTTIVDHSYAADAIAEIATTGIDWTVIDRVMQAGPVLPQPDFDAVDSLPLLLDEAFRVAPEIIVDGMSGANCWFVNGGGTVNNVSIFGEYGPAFTDTPDHVAQPAAPDFAAIEAQYGRIELVVSETRILDQPSIDQAAVTRYDLTKLPVPYITGGELVPTAPLPIDQIVPGALLRVKLNRACKPIDQVMRIQSVAVSANADGSESVDLGLEPIGTVSNG